MADFNALVSPLTLMDTCTPWAVRAAATLRLADHIAGGTTELKDLAAAADADPAALRRLLRYLTCRGVFAETSPGVYGLTDVGEFLRSDHPAGMWRWLNDDGMSGRMESAFSRLTHTIRTGEPGYPLLYGRPFYEDVAADSERAASFNALMADTHGAYFSEVAEAYDWSAAKNVVDVAGGTGALLAEIARAAPGVHGTVVDLPEVVAKANTEFAGQGLADRCIGVAGSIFEPLPAGADVYLLSNILMDWNDTSAVKILTRCAEAAAPNGKVLVIQQLVDAPAEDDQDADPSELLWITQMDLRLLVLMGGQERTLAEYEALAGQAGLDLTAMTRIPSGNTLLELTPTA